VITLKHYLINEEERKMEKLRRLVMLLRDVRGLPRVGLPSIMILTRNYLN